MKSLEIVNEGLEVTNNCSYYCIFKNQLETIKQDLEVLEIIRKKKVDVYYLSIALKFKLPIEEQLYYYNSIEHNNFKLTMEELLKLKQWLEVNDDEN